MAEAGGLTIPPKNDELKKEEEAALHGADLRLNLKMPDESIEVMQIKSSTEVGYVKNLLKVKYGTPVPNITLVWKGKTLIDPMSFCDYPGLEPPEVEIVVEFRT
eukprot:GHVS01028275.1.p1 GENE.GHVS01028275.1~~GHVS01028275.1.p1  ORF type:complete len:104 (+),score=21.81 GHVS01028275.1:257-568(+)